MQQHLSPSVCPSVCLSQYVTCWYCIEMAACSIKPFHFLLDPSILVFWVTRVLQNSNDSALIWSLSTDVVWKICISDSVISLSCKVANKMTYSYWGYPLGSYCTVFWIKPCDFWRTWVTIKNHSSNWKLLHSEFYLNFTTIHKVALTFTRRLRGCRSLLQTDKYSLQNGNFIEDVWLSWDVITITATYFQQCLLRFAAGLWNPTPLS